MRIFYRVFLLVVIFTSCLSLEAQELIQQSPSEKYLCSLAESGVSTEIKLFKTKLGSLYETTFTSVLKKINKAIKNKNEKKKLVKKSIAVAGLTVQLASKLEKLVSAKSILKADKSFVKSCKNGEVDFDDPGGNIGGDPGEDPTPSPSPTASPSPSPSPPGVVIPRPPIISAISGDGKNTVAWSIVNDADSFNIYWKNSPGVTPANGFRIQNVVNPHTHKNLINGTAYYYIVTSVNTAGESIPSNEATATPMASGTSPYDPPWGNIAPTQTINFTYNSAKTSTQNGTDLKAAMNALVAGQRLVIGGGIYTLTNNFTFSKSGTVTAPISIVAKDGETPTLYRVGASQNGIELGTGSTTIEYVLFREIEFNGGSLGIRIHKASNLWLDKCSIHDMADGGINANTQNTDHLYLTRNHIYNIAGYGEGMYIGANALSGGTPTQITHDSIIALNHIHDTGYLNPVQGDGIELKHGSYGNWIVENLVHDNRYPSILVYGTHGMPVNIVERNILFNSGDNVMQVQGEAIVRNNLIMNGGYGFASFDHQEQVKNLTFVHNTIVNSGRAVSVSNWANRPGMVFANNVAYSKNSYGLMFSGGSAGVTVTGNVVYGTVSGASSSGYILGTGLNNFVNVAWDATSLDATPSSGSPIISSGDPTFAVSTDITGATRITGLEAGCFDYTN